MTLLHYTCTKGMKWKWRISLLAICIIFVSTFTIFNEYIVFHSSSDVEFLNLQGSFENRGHLPWMRKDLDASQYRSKSNSQNLTKTDFYSLERVHELLDNYHKEKSVLLELPLGDNNLTDGVVISYVIQNVLKDNTFKSSGNLTKLLTAAELLRSNPELWKNKPIQQEINMQNTISNIKIADPKIKTISFAVNSSSTTRHRIQLYPKELAIIKRNLPLAKKINYRHIDTQGWNKYTGS